MIPGTGLGEWTKLSSLLLKLGRFSLAFGFVAAALGCSRGAEGRSTTGSHDIGDAMQESIRKLSNKDVRWDGNIFGLSPTLTGEAAKMPFDRIDETTPALLAILHDPDRFVVAHVLLTRRPGMEASAFPEWNGLAVELHADGKVVIDPAQRFALARRWERWAKENPRPTSLPPAED